MHCPSGPYICPHIEHLRPSLNLRAACFHRMRNTTPPLFLIIGKWVANECPHHPKSLGGTWCLTAQQEADPLIYSVKWQPLAELLDHEALNYLGGPSTSQKLRHMFPWNEKRPSYGAATWIPIHMHHQFTCLHKSDTPPRSLLLPCPPLYTNCKTQQNAVNWPTNLSPVLSPLVSTCPPVHENLGCPRWLTCQLWWMQQRRQIYRLSGPRPHLNHHALPSSGSLLVNLKFSFVLCVLFSLMSPSWGVWGIAPFKKDSRSVV